MKTSHFAKTSGKFIVTIMMLAMITLPFSGAASCAQKKAAGKVLPIAKSPLALSICVQSRQPDALYSNETLTWRELSKRTNIHFKFDTTYAATSYTNKFRLMMASGQLDDIVCGSIDDLNKYGQMGAFVNLDGLIAKYAPHIKKYLIQDKIVHADSAAPNGKLYCVPMLSAIRTGMGYCIRKDWLDKLHLKTPITIDDWYHVLKAFKEKDPNGNGKHDEVPLILDKAWESYYMNFADAWKIEADPNKHYWMVKNGRIVCSVIQPEFKKFLTTMTKWYKEGLFDKEFATREDTNNFHILNNLAGATCYWTGYVAAQNTNKEVLTKDPKTNWQVIAPPVLKAGTPPKTFSQQAKVVPHAWAISKTNKHPIETIKLFDYVYSNEGSLLFNFGVKSDTYIMKDGTPHYADRIRNNKEGMSVFFKKNGMQAFIGMRQMPEYEADSCATSDIKRQLFDYVQNNRFFNPNPKFALTKDEQDIYNVKMEPILMYIDEMVIKFISGMEPLSNWDRFVAKLNKLGIHDMAKLENTAYVRYKKISK